VEKVTEKITKEEVAKKTSSQVVKASEKVKKHEISLKELKEKLAQL
jgi:hypothetical protein